MVFNLAVLTFIFNQMFATSYNNQLTTPLLNEKIKRKEATFLQRNSNTFLLAIYLWKAL
jgi:hypothetical protein